VGSPRWKTGINRRINQVLLRKYSYLGGRIQ
jgi:hypothetical protein